MNKIKKKLLSLVLAAGMTFSALPASAYADNKKIQGRNITLTDLYSKLSSDPSAYDEYYGSATLEEVLKELCGDYVPLSSSNGISFPYRSNNGSFCIDETGKARNFFIYHPVTVIKVTEGSELPVDEIKHEAAEMGFKPPQLAKDGNTYRLKEMESQDALYCVLNQLADCENVVSITEHIALYEDTANHVSMYGIYIGKNKLSDTEMAEFLNKMSALDPQESTGDASLTETRKKGYRYFFSFGENRSKEQKDIYEAFKYLADTGLSYETMWYKTSLAMLETPVYFCHRDYPLGQKYDFEKTPAAPPQNSEQNGVDLYEVMQEVKLPSEKLDVKYKSMSIEEAFDRICGNCVGLFSSSDDNVLYSSGHGSSIYKIDDKGEIHILNIYGADTAVKVKEGTELSLSQITDGISDKNMRISVQDNIYRITSVSSKENMDILLKNIEKCDNVLSIDEHFVIYEDKANHVSCAVLVIDSQLPDDADKEEIFEKMAEFGLQESADDSAAEYPAIYDSEWRFGFGEDIRKNSEKLYSALKYLSDKNLTYSVPGAVTELGMTTAEVCYCSRPVLVNGITGDANADGQLDMSDAVMIMQSLANPDKYGVKSAKGITAQGIKNGDADNNGLTTNDALAVQIKLLGLEEVKPTCAEEPAK